MMAGKISDYGIVTDIFETVVPITGPVQAYAQPTTTSAKLATYDLAKDQVILLTDKQVIVKPISGAPSYPYVELRWRHLYAVQSPDDKILKATKDLGWVCTSVVLHLSPDQKKIDMIAPVWTGGIEVYADLVAQATKLLPEITTQRAQFAAAMADLSPAKATEIASVADEVINRGGGGGGGMGGAAVAALALGALLLLRR